MMLAALWNGDWDLFGDALLTGVLLAALLPLYGVVLVLRHQVFLAAAIGQAANLGIAIGLWFEGILGFARDSGAVHAHEAIGLVLGMLGAVGVSVSSLRALSARGSTIEARAVWTFLLGGSAAMLLLKDAPHGMQDVQRLMLSSLLGATRTDVWLAAAALGVTLLGLLCARGRLLLWAMDPMTAQVHGQNPLRYDVFVGALVGMVIGFAIHSTGLTFTFGCTVLPVLVARELAPSLAAVLWLSPISAAVLYGVGWVAADMLDAPPGQCAVAVMAIAVLVCRVAMRRRRI